MLRVLLLVLLLLPILGKSQVIGIGAHRSAIVKAAEERGFVYSESLNVGETLELNMLWFSRGTMNVCYHFDGDDVCNSMIVSDKITNLSMRRKFNDENYTKVGDYHWVDYSSRNEFIINLDSKAEGLIKGGTYVMDIDPLKR